VLQAIAARLEDDDRKVRQAAVKVLQGQASLPLDTLYQYLKPLYRALLEVSFEEPISFLVTNGSSYIAVDNRTVLLQCFQGQPVKEIRETQENLDVPLPHIPIA
jgi:hypothetical protein